MEEELRKLDPKSGRPAAVAAGLKVSMDEEDRAAEAKAQRMMREKRPLPRDMRCPGCGLVKANRLRWSSAEGVCRSCAMIRRGAKDAVAGVEAEKGATMDALLIMVHRHVVQPRDIRAARVEVGMKAKDLAAACGWSSAKQTGLENRYEPVELPTEDYQRMCDALGRDLEGDVATTWVSRPHEITRARIRAGISVRDFAILCNWEPHRQMRIEDSRSEMTREEAVRLVTRLRERGV